MTLADLEHFRTLLLEREENLTEWLDSSGSVKAGDARKARSLLGEIKDALGRVENKTFGECKVCKGELELHRLEVQPTRQICLACISKEEQTELEEELSLASKMHRALLPQAIASIEGFEVAVKSLSARTVGGDYCHHSRHYGKRNPRRPSDVQHSGCAAGSGGGSRIAPSTSHSFESMALPQRAGNQVHVPGLHFPRIRLWR